MQKIIEAILAACACYLILFNNNYSLLFALCAYHLVDCVCHGILFLINPILLFNIQRRRYGNVFPIQLGTERWIIFSGSALSEYWKLMRYSCVTALVHRTKVPHLQFPHIQVKDLEEKTKISRHAIVEAIKRNDHRAVILSHFSSSSSSYHCKLVVKDLQQFCFETVSKPMMQWLLGGTVSEQLSDDFYTSMNYYSMNFNPMLFFGLKLDKIGTWFPFTVRTLRYHQSRIEKCIRGIYKTYQSTKGTKGTLVDYYLGKNSITVNEDDFVWLMNATLWAAIHYPSLVLYTSIISILKDPKRIKRLGEFDYIKNVVREVLRLYSATLLPKVLHKDVNISPTLTIKRGDTIAFSPLDCHVNTVNFPSGKNFDPDQCVLTSPLLTGSKGEWSCPAITFSIDWISFTIDQLFKKYHWQYDIHSIPAISYQMVLIHSKEKFSVVLSK
jgi:hypothetical protein